MPSTDEIRREMLNAITEFETEDTRGNSHPAVSEVSAAKAIRDAGFKALSDKGMLRLDE